jgi:hypothetical protein
VIYGHNLKNISQTDKLKNFLRKEEQPIKPITKNISSKQSTERE